MDIRPRNAAVGQGPGWSWPQAEAESGKGAADRTEGSSADRDAVATSTSRDFLHTPAHATFGHASAAFDASDAGVSDAAEYGSDTEAEDGQQDGPEDEPPQDNRWEEYERFKRRYKPRTCRICLEVVEPTFENVGEDEDDAGGLNADAEDVGMVGLGAVEGLGRRLGGRVAGAVASAVPKFLRAEPRVRYVSSEPEDGRLICPCRCKGSQKYVHEGCLKAWRHAQPMSDRNFWKCPTCAFEYRVERLSWGRWISNRVTRVLLTFLVFWLAVFLLGFVADPLIDMWLDPAGLIIDTFIDVDVDADDEILGGLHDMLQRHNGVDGAAAGVDVGASWLEHFGKGLVSLGIVGIVKTFLAVSPWTWWNLRNVGVGRRARRAGGQARIEGFSWTFIVIGVFTFLGMVWKGISYLIGRMLERASEHVIDVQDDNDDEDEDEVADRDHDSGHDEGNEDTHEERNHDSGE